MCDNLKNEKKVKLKPLVYLDFILIVVGHVRILNSTHSHLKFTCNTNVFSC
jgi:hypothetical protein